MKKKIAILGAGSHGQVLLETIKAASDFDILGFFDNTPDMQGKTVLGVPVMGTDQDLALLDTNRVFLANGIGMVQSSSKRHEIFLEFKKKGFHFPQLIHPFSWVSPSAQIGEGCQIMAGAVVQTGALLKENCIVNSSSNIDHHCRLEESVHIAPGATLSGGVKIGPLTHIGTNAQVIQEIRVGREVTVAAGATVCKDIADFQTVMGTPARPRL
ncbi:MAG: acetyltransferase [Pseudomonadota bacterium]